eukprot:716766_1
MQQFAGALTTKISNFWVEEKFESLSSKAGDAIGLIDEIRALGADMYVELPTVAFVGKQSAGKSSLVEALTRITLPRADSTCTRCPVDVRTKRARAFGCQVALRWHRGGDVTVEKFAELSDLEKLEDTVRRAQIVLLNPKHHFNSATDDKLLEEPGHSNERKFTHDSVCVTIRGPEYSNVALVDLPGLIQYIEHEEDRKYIKLVEDLVVHYIKKPNTIIVVIISCKDDIENQVVKALASKYDPKGERTVGVLTKPDTIEPHCHEKWLSILTDKSHRLKLGWFMVKNPSKTELDKSPTFEDNRRSEAVFFTETEPWSEIGGSLHASLGTRALLANVGALLEARIAAQLPRIRDTIHARLERARGKLAGLPTALEPSQVKLRLHNMIDVFAEQLARVVCADEARDWWGEVQAELDGFRVAVARTQPQFALLQGRDEFQSDVDAEGLVRTLEDVQKRLIPDTLGRSLPVTGYGAIVSLIGEFTNKWDAPSVALVRSIACKLQHLTADLVNKNFGEFPKIHNIVSKALQREISAREAAAVKQVRHVVAVEQSPSTLHSTQLAEYSDVYLKKLHAALYPQESAMMSQEQLSALASQCTNRHTRLTDVENLVKKLSQIRGNIARKRGAMEEKALEVIADACAYWRVAFFRFSDYVPKLVDHELLRSFSTHCRATLMDKLNVLQADPAELMKLLAEDPSVALIRKEATRDLERLERISDKLAKFI